MIFDGFLIHELYYFYCFENTPMQIIFVEFEAHGEIITIIQPIQNLGAFFDYQLRELIGTWS